MVIKISAEYKIFAKEINAMKKIHKKLMEATLINKNAAECEVPEVLSYGIIAQKSP